MGKSIQPKPLQVFPKKGILRKNSQCKKTDIITVLHKKPDIIENYLRTLSNNFGSNVTSSSTKRKRDEEEVEEIATVKKPRLVERYDESIEHNIHIYNTKDDIRFEHLTNHLEYDDELKDLFHIDDAKSSNEHTFYVDWLHQLCDEISLEGLDGITVEALWSRIKSNSTHPVLIEGKEEIFWNLLKSIDQIQFFVLEQPRGNLMIYDKNNYVCPETGIVLEPMIDYGEIYPYAMVNRDGVKGSCETYHTRMENSEVVRRLGLKEVLNVYGNRLVIVASQKMREHAIISEISDPTIELLDNEYGLLERVGRARGFGELTQGKVSVLNMIKDSRSIFHVRKSLEGKKLLKKQFFVLRNASSGQNKTGKLLHLPRFYRIQKNKSLLLIEEIVELLRQKPGFSLEFAEFRKYFPRSTGVNKVCKLPEFTKYIKTDIFHPYRFLYPNATVHEWKYKKKNKEKKLRIFQLIDPTVNVTATWNAADNEENLEDELVEDEGQGSKFLNCEFLKEVFSFIFKTGKQGTTLQELVKKISFDYYTIRSAIRKLQAKNVIDCYRTEQGKQRHIYYFARCFHSKNVPIPEKKVTKIPDTLLQKILRDKKSSTNKIKFNFPIMITGGRIIRDSSLSYPLHSPALIKEKTFIDTEMIADKCATNLKNLKFSSNGMTINLPDIRIIPKFCDVIYEHKKKVWSFRELENIITSYSNFNTAVKVILLKSMLMGGKIDVNNMLQGNSSENVRMEMFALDFEAAATTSKHIPSIYLTNKDFLLGPNPIQLSHERTSENMEITITQSTPPDTYIYEYQTYVSFDKSITTVSLARSNIILEEINKHLVICDTHKLQRIITGVEVASDKKREGHGKIDKNTLYRILVRLLNEGYIKIFKIFMLWKEKYKSQWIVAHPSVEITHPSLLSAKEQLVVKFFLGMDKRNIACTEKSPPKKALENTSPFDSQEATSSTQTLKQISRTKSTVVYKQNRFFGRILGYQPKFVRMQLVHELLYYLIYDYTPLDQMSRKDIAEIYTHFNSEERREIPPVYRKNIDWKMFIPPLPVHKNFPSGWALLCDVILSIPLSLWVKIFHVTIECPKLFSYLEHPVRQHYLIKDIPLEFRHALMHKRRYLFYAVEIIYRLCFIGLVQLGPQSAVVKDQIFLYLNRKAGLLDTSSSGPSYHMITQKEYKQLSFTFSSSADVENYWCQLWSISMNTALGQRKVMEGKSVTIVSPTSKSILLDSLKSKTPSEALANDNGQIPGDKRGAAGLDSSMWGHIKRNWLWSSKIPKSKATSDSNPASTRAANIASIKPVAIKYKELMSNSRKIFMTNNRNKKFPLAQCRQKQKHKIIHMPKKATPKPKKTEIDLKDKAIIKKVGRAFRAKFNKNEDKMLYIFRAANYFLSKNKNIFKASRFLIRDLLHILCPESQDKTSGACARRLTKLERSDLNMKRLKEHVYELISLKDLSTHFAPIIFNLNKSTLADTYSSYSIMDKNVVFVHAVWYIYKNYNIVERILSGESKHVDYFSPNNIETFNSLLVNYENKKSVFSSPSSQEDIEKEAVKSVLMSALNCSKLGQNISYQFFQICKKYSDTAIRSAVTSSKGYQAISISKKSGKSGTNIKMIPFQLSITYNHMQKSTFSCLSIHTIYQHFLHITKETPLFADVVKTRNIFKYSRLLARNEVATVWPRHNITLNIPEATYVLSEQVDKESVLVIKLAELYQRYLKDRVKDIHNPLKKIKRPNKGISMNIIEPSMISKRFIALKTNIRQLFSNLPCFNNETINTNIPLFLECTDEDQITKYLKVFLEELLKITLNLLSTAPDGQEFLQRCIGKFYRNKTIDTLFKELEFKLFKLGYIVRAFLMHHHSNDVIDCFENKGLEIDEDQKQIIEAWLEKSKMKSLPTNTTEENKPTLEHKKISSFFKYNMDKTDNETRVITNVDDVPKIDEIIDGMLEPNKNFKRDIPHVSDVVCLLSQEKCPDAEDEKILEELRENLVVEYPTLDKFEIEDLDQFKSSYEYLFSDEWLPDLEKMVNRYCHIQECDTLGMIQKIKDQGGTSADHLLAGEIISYVYNQKVMGVTGSQIMNTFLSKQKNLDLHVIVEIVCDSNILLEVGITEKIFVHVEQSDPWLVDTFHLSPHENHLLHASVNDELQILQKKIASRIQSAKPVKVLMMPWLHLDGTLNRPLLKRWLTIVLSYCLETYSCSFEHIIERFHLVKPMELYVLLKILQRLKCLDIYILDYKSEDLWNDTVEECEKRPATILDSLRKMAIEVQPLAAVSLGHLLSKENIEIT
ncbi:uncharacterized protein LOC123306619 [Coccinella septempunctata]|uniref:uncharacterized protein LOC123306619 n=1 Tax=Coccinella septempunctata TaxID=41139 RepID=UPI001D05FECB|nr:uncharacterized protein LOC123306619 [Coccinella septempunctata]